MTIPTALLRRTETLPMVLLGAGLAFAIVLVGYVVAKLAFRGPDRFGTKLVVGGFLVRLVFLAASLFLVAEVAHVELGRFILWLVLFYFALILAEAWVLARQSAAKPHVTLSPVPEESPSR